MRSMASRVQGTRRRYYSDDGEDAYVMSSPPANTAHTASSTPRSCAAPHHARVAQFYDSLAGAADPRSYSNGMAHGHPRD